jgi:integrase
MPEVISAQQLTPDLLAGFLKRLQIRQRIVGRGIVKVGVKNSTLTTYWGKLNSFFQWLVIKEFLACNPLKQIKKPPMPRYEDSKALPENETDKIIAAIVVHARSSLALRRDLVIVTLLLYCGLRRGELISLQLKDINIYSGVLTIRGETSKSGRTRILPLHPILLTNLKEYILERKQRNIGTEFLLISTTRAHSALTKNGLRHWEKRVNMISGVKFHLHRFRHSFATNLAKKDVSIVKIQKLLGHNSLMMTERYVRSLVSEDLKEDINKL